MINISNEHVFAEFLKEKIKERGYKLRELGRKSGVSYSYLSKIINGNTQNPPSPEVLEKLAEHLHCSYVELMQKAGYLSVVDKREVEYHLPAKETVILPVLKSIVRDKGIYDDTNILNYKKILSEELDSGEYFFLKVQSDLQSSRIRPGDLLLVKRQKNIENGDVAVFFCDDEEFFQELPQEKALVMRLYRVGNRFIIRPDCPELPLIILDKVKIIGKVVKVSFEP